MKPKHLVIACAVSLLAGACGTYATSSVQPAEKTARAEVRAAKSPSQVTLTEGDITDRRYVSLGDISVTVRKITLFDEDPTQQKVADALKERAAELGADAVVFARYGAVGIGFFSYGQREGQGRAIAFEK